MGLAKPDLAKSVIHTSLVNLFLIELHCCHIFSKQMSLGANTMIVYNPNIMQLAVLEDPLARLKAKVFNVQTYSDFCYIVFAF